MKEKIQDKIIGKKCSVCNQIFSDEDIKTYNYIYTKTKRKTEVFCHKSCLIRGY